MDYQKELESSEYDFLRNDPLLKDNILFLTVAGSHAYGTNVETSDLDIRGVVLERETDTLGLTDFEQYVDAKTDTVIYTLKKFLKLVKECNPNIIEMLYSKPEHYLYVFPLGKVLLDNRDLFLTKRAAYSFGGYANAQLNRLENAMARDTLTEHNKIEHINRSVENAAKSFETKYKLPDDAIKTYVGSWYNGMDEEILVDFKLEHYPLGRLRSMIEEMTNVVKNYNETVGQRNKKKDDQHLNKHMMHLIRLYFMCNEILEYKTVHTFREKEHELLMDIRNGKYRSSDGYVTDEFYTLLNDLKTKCDKLKKETTLPDSVDTNKFNELVLKLYKEARK
mgnify:FL=1